jgi:hypothetical protein
LTVDEGLDHFLKYLPEKMTLTTVFLWQKS